MTQTPEHGSPGPPQPAPSAETFAEARSQSRRRRRIRWFTQESVGAAALVLSLSLAGVNAWETIRGSDIVVAVQPTELYLYRDQGPRSAGLSMAIRVPLVNRAGANYGDVVTAVSATLARAGEAAPRFAYQSVVEPIATDRDAAELQRNCDIHVRCVPATRFLAVERLQALVDLPGGASRDQSFGFPLDQAYCTGSPACARYVDFDSALAALYSGPVDVRIAVSFSSDRQRGAICAIRITPAQRDYLVTRGWVTLPCLPPSSRSS